MNTTLILGSHGKLFQAMPTSINFQKECPYLPSSATTVPFCPWKPQAWTLLSILWWFTYDKNEFGGVVVWLSREWIHISPTLCTERSQNKFCWLQTMVTWVFFFHRERKVAEYGNKRDSYLLRTCYMPSTILDVLGPLSYEILSKPCLSARIQLQNRNISLVT